MLRLLTRVEPADHHNIIPANHLLRLHKPQQHPTNWADYFYQKLDKVCAQHNNTIQHPMILMPLICHLAAWKLDKTNFLMGKGVWPFINGDEQEPVLGAAPTAADLKTFKEWHEKARKVMYWLSVSVSDSMIVHIQDAETLKEAWIHW